MDEEFIKKVILIAKYKYELDEEILEEYKQDIELCWNNDFTPTRTVEYIAEQIF